MPVSQKICLLVLILLTLMASMGYLSAIHTVHWFLRVGVPEIGWMFLIPALPAALWLGRGYPRTAVLLVALLAGLVLWPWFRAVGVAQAMKEGLGPYHNHPHRYPLFLGQRSGHEKATEDYSSTQKWDRYEPDGPSRATVLFVHGGSWRNGTREEYPQLFDYLADRGYRVLSISYTLSGEAPYPAAPDDVARAIVKAREFHQPVFLMGRSSGGHLALLSSYTHPDLVDGVVGIYSPVDMVWSYEHPSNPAVLDSCEAIREFLGGTPDQSPDIYREASPIDQVGRLGPATLLIHGGSDSLVYHKQSEMLSDKLEQVGVDHYLLTLPWAEHGGDITIYGPSGRLSAWAIECFLESRLNDL